MATIEQRIERLETKRDGQEDKHTFNIRFVRPGDGAVVSELRLESGKMPVWTHHVEAHPA